MKILDKRKSACSEYCEYRCNTIHWWTRADSGDSVWWGGSVGWWQPAAAIWWLCGCYGTVVSSHTAWSWSLIRERQHSSRVWTPGCWGCNNMQRGDALQQIYGGAVCLLWCLLWCEAVICCYLLTMKWTHCFSPMDVKIGHWTGDSLHSVLRTPITIIMSTVPRWPTSDCIIFCLAKEKCGFLEFDDELEISRFCSSIETLKHL